MATINDLPPVRWIYVYSQGNDSIWLWIEKLGAWCWTNTLGSLTCSTPFMTHGFGSIYRIVRKIPFCLDSISGKQ